MGRNRTLREAAEIIERFVQERSLYAQEWNDFVDMSQRDMEVEAYRKRCYELDPLVNCPGERDAKAIAELKNMVDAMKS